MTSIEGVRAAPGYAAYAAAKAGVINFTKTAALELAPHGIRVNALAPDITLTEGMASVAPPGAEKRFGLTVPMGRPGHVDEMAGAAVFLAGELSSYVTGQTIHVDGGTQASSGWYHHPVIRRLRPRSDLIDVPGTVGRRPSPFPVSSLVLPEVADVGRHAAVDGDHLSGDVARLVGGQEDDELGDVVGLAQIWGEGRPPQNSSMPSVRWARTASVMMSPGTIVLTRTPCLPWPAATYIVSVLTPALETPYGGPRPVSLE